MLSRSQPCPTSVQVHEQGEQKLTSLYLPAFKSAAQMDKTSIKPRLQALISQVPTIVSLNPFTIQEVLEDILKVGQAVGRQQNAEIAVDGMRQRIAAAAAVGQAAAQQREIPLKVRGILL